MRALIFSCLVGWVLLGLAEAATGTSTPEDLVRQLGDREFHVREAASQALIRLGDKALPAVQAGMRDSDPEIRRRCFELHRQLLRLGLEHRIKRFLDSNSKEEAALPLWERFSKLVGADPETRRFYADIVRAGYEVLDKTERAERSQDEELQREAREAFQQLCETIYQTIFTNAARVPGVVAPEAFAVAIFLATHPVNQDQRPNTRNQLYNLCYQHNIRQAITNGDASGRVLRRLLAAWLSQETETNMHIQGLSLALDFDLPELMAVAKQVVENKKVHGYARGLALTVVAKYGGKKEIAFIERFLADETNVTSFQVAKQNNPVVYKTEIRDWALTLLIHLTGQKLRDYPFPVLQAVNPGGNLDPIRTYMPHYFGFNERSEREAVFRKWQQWRVDNPLP